jgi:hypothetical protein
MMSAVDPLEEARVRRWCAAHGMELVTKEFYNSAAIAVRRNAGFGSAGVARMSDVELQAEVDHNAHASCASMLEMWAEDHPDGDFIRSLAASMRMGALMDL